MKLEVLFPLMRENGYMVKRESSLINSLYLAYDKSKDSFFFLNHGDYEKNISANDLNADDWQIVGTYNDR